MRYDAELPAVIYSVFRDLGIGPFTIQINNRKLMRGYLEALGIDDAEQQALVLREVDKLDKRGAEHVRDTLTGEAFALVGGDRRQAARIRADALDVARRRDREARCARRRQREARAGQGRAQGSADARQGVRRAGNAFRAESLDRARPRLLHRHRLRDDAQRSSARSARSARAAATRISPSHYTKSKLPGVGISIGATRLYWQLREAGLLAGARSTVQVLVAQMDEAELPRYLALATRAARCRHQHRSRHRAGQARATVQVRRSRRHPLRARARARRDRAKASSRSRTCARQTSSRSRACRTASSALTCRRIALTPLDDRSTCEIRSFSTATA